MFELELTGERLPHEQLPYHESQKATSEVSSEAGNTAENIEELNDEQLSQRLEMYLLHRIDENDRLAPFQLGQIYYEQGRFEEAKKYFEMSVEKNNDYQGMFQLGIILYDGIGCQDNPKLGVEYMMTVAATPPPQVKHLVRAAQYNIGRAHFQGFGVKQSDEEAERWWLLAADDGSPSGSVLAQTTLGYYYARQDSKDLKKSFFWHSEACGNGSLESQGALGVMYLYGLGVKKDVDSAFECLRESSDRGNVYAMGHLIQYYYHHKLFTKTAEMAFRVAQLKDINQIANETGCLPAFVAKGIAMACFIYGRCLHFGNGVLQSNDEAKVYYSRCYEFDPDTCARYQTLSNQGKL
ncbi:LRP2-binding protein-like isoform X2 [Tubulanus polymorphus]|uniref:LRP2-binding protein-like isoform X2 n=1 Tax=Tubulanus polymorphus TaxID=672921 RepID=UPI003DA4DD58